MFWVIYLATLPERVLVLHAFQKTEKAFMTKATMDERYFVRFERTGDQGRYAACRAGTIPPHELRLDSSPSI